MTLKDLLGKAYKDGMTVEDISKALEPLSFVAQAEHEKAVAAMKDTVSKANSEAADYKRQLREKMTEAEKAEAARHEADSDREKEFSRLQAQIDEMTKANRLTEIRTQFLESGYSKELAEKAAAALMSNDSTALVAVQNEHMTAREQQLKADLLKGTPRPGVVPPAQAGTGTEPTPAASAKEQISQSLQGFFASNPPTTT